MGCLAVFQSPIGTQKTRLFGKLIDFLKTVSIPYRYTKNSDSERLRELAIAGFNPL